MANLEAIIVLAVIGALTGCSNDASNTSTGANSAATPPAASTQDSPAAPPAPPPKPAVALSVASDGEAVYASSVLLHGKVTRGAKVSVDSKHAEVDGKHWKFYVTLDHGDNFFTIKAKKHGYTAASADADVTRKLTAAEKAAIRQANAERRANKRALQTAQDYLAEDAFSKQGLYEQLSSSAGEGFTPAQAQYAVDHVRVDWNQEAVESARSYLQMDSMSRSELIDQLSSSAGEGFTYAQALYAVDKVY